jgi:prepilin-type N-terminal cleavage/methylation domain-containing protein/prepilin-type processing-associated H-X9-DG protein
VRQFRMTGYSHRRSDAICCWRLPCYSLRYHRAPLHGFTAIELALVLAVLALLAAILIPALSKPKARASRIHCISNMMQIGMSFMVWGNDHQGQFPMAVAKTNGGTLETALNGGVFQHFQAISNELSTPRLLICPEDKNRRSATTFAELADTNVSYLVGIDSVMGSGSGLVSGDRNITNTPPPGDRFVLIKRSTTIGWSKDIHSARGNLAFGDGSAAAFVNGDSRLTFTATPERTNRLAIP